jgi:hypothetical protein
MGAMVGAPPPLGRATTSARATVASELLWAPGCRGCESPAGEATAHELRHISRSSTRISRSRSARRISRWSATARVPGVSSSAAAVLTVSAIKPYEGFGDVNHTIKELMSLWDYCAAWGCFTGANKRMETPQLHEEGYLCSLEKFIYFIFWIWV